METCPRLRSRHTKSLEMVPDTSLINTQQYKLCFKSKGKQLREKISALSYISV